MGSSRYDSSAFAGYTRSTAKRTLADYHPTMHSYVDSGAARKTMAKEIKIRESRRSVANPHPTPIILGVDATGSMGYLAEECRKQGGILFEEIIKRNPVSDPHVMMMIIGDMDTDQAPVQATQFEADPVTIGKQIEELYLEGNGGGNMHESYLGPWYFAQYKTICDAFSDTPPRKGFLFTAGDEGVQEVLTSNQIARFLSDKDHADITAENLLAIVERNWHVYHLMVAEGSHMRSYHDKVTMEWRKLMGERAILLTDHTKMSQVIISIMEVMAGRDKDAVAKSWDGSTELVVAQAIAGLPADPGLSAAGAGPVKL